MKPGSAKPSDWFELSRYSDAAQLDASDWFLNLLFRNWLGRTSDGEGESFLQSAGPLLRRDDRDQINELQVLFLGREEEAPSGLLTLACGQPLASGISPFTVETFYFFERRLPDAIRTAGATYEEGGFRRDGTPPAFYGRLDHAFQPQMVNRFVRVNLALPDDILVEDLKRFLKTERSELASIGGRQPYRDAIRAVDKTRGRNLGTLASVQLLPYLDVHRWLGRIGDSISDYRLAKIIGLDGASRLRETRRYVDLVADQLALRAWLEPVVRGVPPKSKRRR